MATLYLLTTPIGNIEDLTPRARQLLIDKDYFLAEDTRVLKKLSEMIGLDMSSKTILSFNDHDQNLVDKYTRKMDEGIDIVFASDAGSPIISDPAYPLVKAALEKGHQIDSAPGVSSVIVALELSGLPPHPFTFHGFLPRESSKQMQLCDVLKSVGQTHVFFESPHRIVETINLLVEQLPNANFSLCRELTKKFQDTQRFSSSEWGQVRENLVVKGEFVVVLNLPSHQSNIHSEELLQLAQQVREKADPKNLSKLLGYILEAKPKEIYQELIHQKAKSK